MPLRAEIISRPARAGEKLGMVVDQYPKVGRTLSSWDTVRIVTAESPQGPIPRLVGLRVSRAEEILSAMGLKSSIESAAGRDARDRPRPAAPRRAGGRRGDDGQAARSARLRKRDPASA